MKNYLSSLFFLITSITTYAQDRITGKNFATRSEIIASNGMIATSHPLATQIGLDILKKGGTAIDAAIAANAALGLMEPTGSGIGGDLFAIIWDGKTKTIHGLNASGRSPKSLTLGYFQSQNLTKIPSFGPLPVSVPGAVDGWFELHEKFGSLPMIDILAPAINYAENGFPVTELIAHYMSVAASRYEPYNFQNFKSTFMIDGMTPSKGQIFRNPDLAKTYKIIAKKGRADFYEGTIAETIADYVQAKGGFLSKSDLAAHHSEWVKPVSVNYRGYDIWELPPNGQGITALQMLNILEGYDFKNIPHGSAEHIHLFTETKKLAFEDRAKYYADMDFYDFPMKQLLSKDYAEKRRNKIGPNAGIYKAGSISNGETVYLTVADKNGTMISLIQSNYRGMGSGLVPTNLGFMLQNRGELFSLEKGRANTYAPEKRPFHTIIPGFVTKNGTPLMSFGVMGGDFQPIGHVQIVMNIIDFGMSLQEAGDAPRIDHTGTSTPTGFDSINSGEIRLESGFDYESIRTLMNKGHKVGFALGTYGGYQAILWDDKNKVYFGASESRKDGQAAGY